VLPQFAEQFVGVGFNIRHAGAPEAKSSESL
jgi:hypothetical protein